MLTPLYPASDLPTTDTPVVHFFTKEWAKMGYNILVIHYVTNFPKLFYHGISLIKDIISSKVGFIIRDYPIPEFSYEIDGVHVQRIPMEKIRPHGRFSSKIINETFNKTIDCCAKKHFVPDCIIGHWFNPQLEIINLLKEKFNVPTCIVAHDSGIWLKTIYKDEKLKELWKTIDVLGFRSASIRKRFETEFGYKENSFMCYSGMPEEFLPDKKYRTKIGLGKFIFTGTLIKRKYPSEILTALNNSLGAGHYNMVYIGAGKEEKAINRNIRKYGISQHVHLLGRIPKHEVQNRLRNSDVFIMISKNETFGLVYLEAMAAGCITIASKNEGFDGIIEDGVNGFLCNAGDSEELASIIRRIKSMDQMDLLAISNAAIDTAYELSEKKVAVDYINSISSIVKKRNV